MKRVDIVFFDAGSGHRSAARALENALRIAQPEWTIRSVDLLEVIAANQRFSWYVQRGIRWFNDELKREKMFDLRGKVNLSLLVHDFLSAQGLREIAQFWNGAAPDALVSVTPMYNPALFAAARLQNPRVCCVTIPVDFEEFKKRYWFTPKSKSHYLNATEILMEQAAKRGIPLESCQRISGMLADPLLYQTAVGDRAAELKTLGLDPSAPTLLVHFGGQGSVVLLEIAQALQMKQSKANVILLCGKSEAVAGQIRALETAYKKVALGYLPETPVKYQQLCDVIIGKPGTQTITEALVARRALVLLESTGMKPVQRGNEEWVRARGVGVIAKSAAEIPQAVNTVLEDPSYRARAEENRHRGVFEAADAIGKLITG